MREPALDSSEDLYSLRNTEDTANLYSLSATTTDIFDFGSADTFTSAQVQISKQTSRLVTFLKSFFGTFVSLFVGSFKIAFEFFTFLISFVYYLRSKIVGFVRFLDISKDQIVSTLMWRRGLLFRPATHGGVVVMAAIAVVAGGLFTRGQIAAQDLTPQESVLNTANTTQTIIPTDRPRAEVMTYKVAGGDTLSTLADKFGVSTDSIKWVNAMNSDALQPNQELKIPPVTGVVYTVKAGDTIDTVAKAYQADAQTIVDFPFNYVDDTLSLRVGQTLYVPGGLIPQPKPVVSRAVAKAPAHVNLPGGTMLAWPVPRKISQYFSWFHQAIDLNDPTGTPIYAAANGRIIDAKRQTVSFGWYCIEDIGNGWTVAYAHMSAQYCYVGQTVTRGELLGAVGMTGRATGPHLHFEVRHNGVAVDPLTLLP